MKKLLFSVCTMLGVVSASNAATQYLTSDQDIAALGEKNAAGNTLAFQYGNGTGADEKGPLTYTLSADTQILADQIFVLPGHQRSITFDFAKDGDHKLSLGTSGINYTTQHNSVLGAGDSYVTYKGGVWDFTPGTGYIKLLGRWNSSSGGEPGLHVTLDSTTFMCENKGRQGQLMVGGLSSSVVITNSEFTINDVAFATFPANTETTNPSTNNTITVVDSTFTSGGFHTDYRCKVPTTSVDNDLEVTFDSSIVNLSAALDVGDFLDGNTVRILNGSEVNSASGGIRMGVESGTAISSHNTLEVKDSTVTLTGGHVFVGYRPGSSYNEALFENSTLSAVSIRAGSVDNTAGSENPSTHNKVTLRNNTLKITDYYPLVFGGRDGQIVLDNQTLIDKSSSGSFQDFVFSAQSKDRVNNEFDLLNGSVFECRGFAFGAYGSQTATNNTLVVGEDSKLILHGQFMNTGLDNTIVIDNGTISEDVASQWAFYLGYRPSGDTTYAKYPASSGTKVYFKGDHPLIIVTNATGNAQLNIGEDTKLYFSIPADGKYKEVPIQVDQFCLQHSKATDDYPLFFFENLDAVVTNITQEMDIVLMQSNIDSSEFYVARTNANAFLDANFPGCKLSQDKRQLVLHVAPHYVASVTHNGTKTSYANYELVNEALEDGDTITMIAGDHETFPITGKDVTLNVNWPVVLPWDLQLTDGAAVTMSSASTSLQYGRSSVKGDEKSGYSLTVKDSTLTIPGQFMICGSNNTVTVDNGTIDVTSKYAIYLGHARADVPTYSSDNTIVIKGTNPVIKASYNYVTNDMVKYDGDAQFLNTKIIVELPTDPADIYTEAPFQAGNSFYFPTVNNVTVEFKNLAELQQNLTKAIRIPLVWLKGRNNGVDATAFTAAKMPEGCSIIYDQSGPDEHIYLEVHISNAQVSVDDAEFKSMEEASEAIKDNSVIRLLNDSEGTLTIDSAQNVSLNQYNTKYCLVRNVVVSGSTVNDVGGYFVGLDNPTPGKQTPVENYTMTLTGGSEFLVNKGQFMFCGTNNTLTVDDSLLSVTNYQYTFYFGHSYDTNPGVSADNTLTFKGANPQIVCYNDDTNKPAQLSVQNSHVVFVLTPGELWTKPVMRGQGSAYLDKSCTVEFQNLDEVIADLKGEAETFTGVDVPLIAVDSDKYDACDFLGENLPRANAELPKGCFIYKNSGCTAAFLHIGPESDAPFAEGCGSQDNPYVIATTDDLAKLDSFMKNYDSSAICFLQTDDFTVTDWKGLGQNDAGYVHALPFKGFRGIYDGDGHTVTMTMAAGQKYSGFFNEVRSGAVLNLTVEVNNGEDNPIVGGAGIVGVIGGSQGVISNCCVKGTIVGTSNCGGIAVKMVDYATLIDCVNEADITSSGTKLGGMFAFAQQDDDTNRFVTVTRCVNKGSIKSTSNETGYDKGVGGLMGWVRDSANVWQCSNENKDLSYAENPKAVGEIVGMIGKSGFTSIFMATNTVWVNVYRTGYGMIANPDTATVTGLDAQEQPETPVTPGEPIVFDDEPTDQQLSAYKAGLNEDQEEVLTDEQKATYKGMFHAVKSQNAAGQWLVTVVPTEAAAQELQKNALNQVSELLTAEGQESEELSFTGIPGFYYQLDTGSDIGALESTEEGQQLCTGDEMSFTIPQPEEKPTANFFKMHIDATPAE